MLQPPPLSFCPLPLSNHLHSFFLRTPRLVSVPRDHPDSDHVTCFSAKTLLRFTPCSPPPTRCRCAQLFRIYRAQSLLLSAVAPPCGISPAIVPRQTSSRPCLKSIPTYLIAHVLSRAVTPTPGHLQFLFPSSLILTRVTW